MGSTQSTEPGAPVLPTGVSDEVRNRMVSPQPEKRRYASLVRELLGIYFPLPFADDEANREALLRSNLRGLWCTIYSKEQALAFAKDPAHVLSPKNFRLEYPYHEVELALMRRLTPDQVTIRCCLKGKTLSVDPMNKCRIITWKEKSSWWTRWEGDVAAPARVATRAAAHFKWDAAMDGDIISVDGERFRVLAARAGVIERYEGEETDEVIQE